MSGRSEPLKTSSGLLIYVDPYGGDAVAQPFVKLAFRAHEGAPADYDYTGLTPDECDALAELLRKAAVRQRALNAARDVARKATAEYVRAASPVTLRVAQLVNYRVCRRGRHPHLWTLAQGIPRPSMTDIEEETCTWHRPGLPRARKRRRAC